MEYRGDLRVPGNALKLKQDPNAVDESGRRIRLLKIWCGGMLRGAISAGASEAVQEAGIGNVAIAHGTISAGGPTAVALVLKRAHETVKKYEELEEKQIFALSRGKMTFRLDELMNDLAPILDDPALLQLREEIYALVTNPENGEGELLDVKRSMPNCKAAVAASMAMPHFFSSIEVNGFRRCDGAWADFQIALAALLRKFRPTDVWVFVNSPKNPDWVERAGYFVGNFRMNRLSAILEERTSRMEVDLEMALDRLVKFPKVRAFIQRPKSTDGFFPWTTTPRVIRSKANQMKSFTEGILNDARKLVKA